MKLFLTSSVHAVAHHIAKKFNLSEGTALVFIDTAAEAKSGDKEWLANDRKALVDAGFEVSDYTITDRTKDQLETDLEPFHFIYISGGDTAYLLEQSQKTGFGDVIKDLILKKNKTYIGTSAGSIIAGPRLPVYFKDRNYSMTNLNGYGFVNFTILPHWGSPHFRKKYLGERMKITYTEDQVPLLLLTDTQYVEISDSGMQIVETRQ